MNNYRNTDKDIHTRIHRLVIGCFRDIVQKIPKKPENIPIIQQIASSLTSMGANDQEADAAGSKRDFIAKFTIVRKETKETKYWLTFVKETALLSNNRLDTYIDETQEILSIVSKIIQNLSKIS